MVCITSSNIGNLYLCKADQVSNYSSGILIRNCIQPANPHIHRNNWTKNQKFGFIIKFPKSIQFEFGSARAAKIAKHGASMAGTD